MTPKRASPSTDRLNASDVGDLNGKQSARRCKVMMMMMAVEVMEIAIEKVMMIMVEGAMIAVDEMM